MPYNKILKEELAPVIKELREAGYDIESVYDLYPRGVKLNKAIPILVKWLPRVRDEQAKEVIVRALTDRQARKKASPVLIAEFREHALVSRLNTLAWAIGNALSVVADDDAFEAIAELVRDRRYGRNREMLAVAFGNMKDPATVGVLKGLLQDEDVAGHAVMALGKLKAAEARADIEKFLEHEKPWIRQEAKRALAKIDKAANKG